MAELTVANLFDKALEATSTGIKASGYASAGPWDVLIPRLRAVLGETFDPAKASALSELRAAVRKAGLAKVSEGAFLADGAGLAKTAQGAAMVGAAAVSRCAAVKLLRHTYHHTRRHSHKMWIVSLPEAFSQWPHKTSSAPGKSWWCAWGPTMSASRPVTAPTCPPPPSAAWPGCTNHRS